MAVAGILVDKGTVRPEWIDYNGHMNVAYYVLAFDDAVDALWARIGVTQEYLRTERGSTFAVETHVTYQKELKQDEAYVVTMQLLAYDEKRIHHFQRMYHADEGYLAATAEWLSLHVDLDARRVSAWPASVLEQLAVLVEEQGDLAKPNETCEKFALKSPIFSTY